MKCVQKLGVALLVISALSCTSKDKGWVFEKQIALQGVNPIGISGVNDHLWLSDGDHNRVVKIDVSGAVLTTIDSLDRPMHIDMHNNQIMIPQYGNDEVVVYKISSGDDVSSKPLKVVQTNDSLDAPAGVSFRESEIAIADFYNNRIHYKNQSGQWIVFGKEGKGAGDFYYPTDVQLTASKIWVADAYNNRVQAFDKKGNHLKTIGFDQKMNATTGIYVTQTHLLCTDFENNRVLVFDLDGKLIQQLDQTVSKPTDVFVKDNVLYVANYKGSSLSVFRWGELPKVHSGLNDEHNHVH